MLSKRVPRSVVQSKSRVAPIAREIIVKAGTDLPGIPHPNRVCRLYRQWLKLAVLCPHSLWAELNEHAQMNERVMTIVRQKFREGAEERDAAKIAQLITTCERSLFMFREIAADVPKRKYTEGLPRLHMDRSSMKDFSTVGTMQYIKEYWNTYIKRKW